jgi:hypothetical protein
MLFAIAQHHPIAATCFKNRKDEVAAAYATVSVAIKNPFKPEYFKVDFRQDRVLSVRHLMPHSFLIDFTGSARAVLIVL